MLNKTSDVAELHQMRVGMPDSVDSGVLSDLYASRAERRAVHEMYELGNEAAAEKNEPLFDNRVGFTNKFDAAMQKWDDGDTRDTSHHSNGQYGEGGMGDRAANRAIRHHMLQGDTPDRVLRSQPVEKGNSWADRVAASAPPLPTGADLNNPTPTPPQEVQEKLDAANRDKPANRTNDSTVAPQKPKADILKGFHGG